VRWRVGTSFALRMDVAIPTVQQLHPWRDPRTARLIAAGSASALLVATAAALSAGGSGAGAYDVVLRATMVAAPLGTGLYAWSTRRYARFGQLLIASGALAFVTTLAETSDPVLYTTGRTAGWLLEIALVVLLLAFPSGRLKQGTDRRLAIAMAVVIATFFLPVLLLADRLKVPSPYTSCARDCPSNPLALMAEPVGAVLFGVGGLLGFLVIVAVVVRLQQDVAAALPAQRRMLIPVLAVGIARATLLGFGIVGRELGPDSQLTRVSVELIALATPLMALAFLVGLARTRRFSEDALWRLAACARRTPELPTLRRAFAESLNDPTFEITVVTDDVDGPWTDYRGAATGSPHPQDGRTVRLVRDRDGHVIAALSCDAALANRPELLEGATAIAAVSLNNLRLIRRAETATEEVSRSRARIAATADRERRRIERDLHDGAQQRLVAVRIELGLVEDLVHSDPERCTTRIHQLKFAVDDALEELRSLAHGVCPPLLADRGLGGEALQGAAARCTVPVRFEASGLSRYRPEIESAVYFCILEALQNVAKHAAGARNVRVHLEGGTDGRLLFSVRDNGTGLWAGEAATGVGIDNMRDRISAVGGELTVRSHRGTGTDVSGWVPIPTPALSDAQRD
jgi:signal transduction histidine kinase